MRTLFWVLVLVFNVAVFGLAVGTMILYFDRDPVLGGGLIGLGLVAGVLGLMGYRHGRTRLEDA